MAKRKSVKKTTKKRTKAKKQARASPVTHAANSRAKGEAVSFEQWIGIIVIVAALLIIGILAGVGNLVQKVSTTDYAPATPVIIAGDKMVHTAMHDASVVSAEADWAVHSFRMQGTVQSTSFDESTGKWNVMYQVLGPEGQTADIEVVIADGKELVVEKVGFLLPVEQLERKEIEVGDSPVKGAEAASVTIVEYSDFECPFCKQIAPIYDELLAEYPDDVRVVFKHFPISEIHPRAQAAAEAAECMKDQDLFWVYHKALFINQGDFTDEDFRSYVLATAGDITAFDECYASGEKTAIVQSDFEEGLRMGVDATPTVFINGKKYITLLTPDDFKAAIEAELNR